ncbi:MAG: polysaccharide ABC transporter ATP-binding protein [Verrucomicrobiota bacterium]
MSDVIISAENIGKSYTLDHRGVGGGYRKFSDTLIHTAKTPLRWLKQGRGGSADSSSREEFWALKDVSFEIKRGEVVGIIGRNGAGKSTLLKILSRITEPTKGRITLDGRVASLLEVGTGFHPELTGRENIYLNGAILGMRKEEIRSKFDEIVAFAEIEKFLDTPVKRYSSGMYVRLAFAVAAHLEPEILIVDEVLAVGDSQFQAKCLGKMKDVATGGRTVLFVSHNMAAVKSLTTRCLLMQQGALIADGSSEDIISKYLRSGAEDTAQQRRRSVGKHTSVISACFRESQTQDMSCRDGKEIHVDAIIRTDGTPGMSVELFLVSPSGERVALFSLSHFHDGSLPRKEGVFLCGISLAPLNLASGRYTLDVATSLTNIGWDDYLEQALVLNVEYCNPSNLAWDMKESFGFGHLAWPGVRTPTIEALELPRA